MNSRTTIVLISILAVLVLLTGACSAGFVAGRVFAAPAGASALRPDAIAGGMEEALRSYDSNATPEDLDQLFEPFWQAWDMVHEQFVDQPVDDEVLMRGAIQGMLDSLGDAHTSYLTPEMFERSEAHLQGEEYEGIGAWVDITGDYLTIISPMPGSPAKEAGLQPDDKVIAVDGDDMTGIDGELVRQRVIGPAGSEVTLTIQREGLEEPFDVTLKRASIIVPSVEGEMLEDNIAYVRLYTFGDETAQDLRDILRELMAQNPEGIILDLRYNGGGYLQTAVDVASQFIGDGIVMYEEYGDGTRTTYEARRGGLATDIPMVVLINEGSASASEIVAGAIQDRERGLLVGTTSFGKGSVQNYSPLVNDQGAIRVTIARWLTPNERQINGSGLEPDVLVELTEEDFAASIDAQLDKAIELLRQ
ncbi:MAG TPA: S41 family peptidase [Anaerolineales bacterium]|nr:S41 family peptidase [Anaerolineales bacterium]